ncbi:Vacuolar cation/proton exchanger 5 [Trifolium repens]|nr:Vacuolar cation/proton exchanger 5 [Trifolium repens]
MAFTTAFFYKGFFVKDPEQKYVGGEVRQYKADSDKWSFFEIDGIIRDFDKDAGTIRIWWKHAETPLETGLLKIANDEDALIVSNYVVGQDAEVLIYVEYVTDATSNVVYPVCVDEVNGVRSNDKGKATAITSDEEGDGSDIDDSDDSDYSELDVHFNDSEEERGLAVDDGFEPEVVENVVEGHAEVVENVVEGTSQVVKNVVQGTSQDHEIANDDYNT